MPRIEFGLSLPKQKIVRTLIVERDRAIQETNEALGELAQALSSDLAVPAGGRWMFWSNEAGKISLVYDTPDPSVAPSLPIPAPEPSAEGQGQVQAVEPAPRRSHHKRRAAAGASKAPREQDAPA